MLSILLPLIDLGITYATLYAACRIMQSWGTERRLPAVFAVLVAPYNPSRRHEGVGPHDHQLATFKAVSVLHCGH